MALLPALVAATSDAPLDWVLGAAASIVFVALIAIPATVMNAREHKRHQADKVSTGS